jgi:hypothetical protein
MLRSYAMSGEGCCQTWKMLGFDLHTHLTDMMVSNGNLQFLWHALPKDK